MDDDSPPPYPGTGFTSAANPPPHKLQPSAPPLQPAQSGFAPPPQPIHYGPGNVIYIQPSYIHTIIRHRFGERPEQMECPFCKTDVATTTRRVSGKLTWIACCVLCFVFPFICMLPFFFDQFKDVVHECPDCKHVIGRHNRV